MRVASKHSLTCARVARVQSALTMGATSDVVGHYGQTHERREGQRNNKRMPFSQLSVVGGKALCLATSRLRKRSVILRRGDRPMESLRSLRGSRRERVSSTSLRNPSDYVKDVSSATLSSVRRRGSSLQREGVRPSRVYGSSAKYARDDVSNASRFSKQRTSDRMSVNIYGDQDESSCGDGGNSMLPMDEDMDGFSPLRRHQSLEAGVLTAHLLIRRGSDEMENLMLSPEDCQVTGVGQALEIINWMRQACPEMVPMAPLLEDIMFTGFKQSRMTEALPPDVRHRNLEHLVVEIVRGVVARNRRLLLVIEDAQWMNLHSMKLLLQLASAKLRVMVVISARPFEEYFETVPNEFTGFCEMSTTVEMAPLSPAECRVLATAVIGESTMAAHPDVNLLPPGSDLVLHQKSGGGNPLFVRNIAITLRENLLGNGTVKVLAELPAGFFHSLIVSRFDALEPLEQTVLKAATVVGATFGKRLLLHMLPINSRERSENLHVALLKLIEANFISRSVVGQTERFSFVHTAVQETIYKMMLTDQKETLHEVCAAWYEKHHRHSATYKSIIMHHWMRSGNTYKKVQCHMLAAAKSWETFDYQEVIQHMLALLAIAFGKDMATVTVISLEPVLDILPPSKPQPAASTAPSVASVPAGKTTGKLNVPVEPTGGKGVESTPPPDGTVTDLANPPMHPKSATSSSTTSQNGRKDGGKGGEALKAGCHDMMCGGRGWKRSRSSAQVLPVAPGGANCLDTEAAERQETVRTAARLGCAAGNLTKERRALLVAKDQEWLWAADFLPCTEFSDPRIFGPSKVARWMGEIGMAHLRLGRLLPAHNHMQVTRLSLDYNRQRSSLNDRVWCGAHLLGVRSRPGDGKSPNIVSISLRHKEALAYLGFKPLPSHALPAQRLLCIALESARQYPRDREDTLFAARLYGAIADISIKTGMSGNLAFINRLVKASIRGVEEMDTTPEGIHLIVNRAQEALTRGKHRKAEALLAQAVIFSTDIDDSFTKGVVLISAGMYNAGQGMLLEAEDDFASAFEMFAPAGDTSRCGEVMIESAYVKVCAGDTEEALFMFKEVRDVAVSKKDDYLSQSSLHGAALVCAITGKLPEASASIAQLRSLIEDDWARRRGRRGRTAGASEGTSQPSLVVMEVLEAYIAAARGDGHSALKRVCRASLRLSRSSPIRFSSGLFLHLATEACFTLLERAILPPGHEARRRILGASQLLVRNLARFAKVFDLMAPLYQLGRARWNLVLGRESAAEKDLDSGLTISEEHVTFPYAEGLLLLHSTRLRCLTMKERRARARLGRRTLRRIGACLIPYEQDLSHTVPILPVTPQGTCNLEAGPAD